MNKTLKNKVVKYLQNASKTYEAIANNQRKAGNTKDATVSPSFPGYDQYEGIVDFLECGFVVTDRKTFAKPLFTENDHVEIIGNIYDNPELLEK